MKLAVLLQNFMKQTFSNDFLIFLGTFISNFTKSTVATYKTSLSDFLKRLLIKLILLIALGMPFKRQSSILTRAHSGQITRK